MNTRRSSVGVGVVEGKKISSHFHQANIIVSNRNLNG